MAFQNARLIEKDILTAIPAGASGDSTTIDLQGASKFSCQAVYDVQSPAAAAILVANITLSSNPTHPSEFMKAAHGFATGTKVQATTAGTLAVPLVAVTDYYVIKVSADYFALATSQANAIAGTRIAITDVGVTSTTLTMVALSGASVTFRKSNDATNWIDVQTATAITVDGSVMIEAANVSYRYLKVVKALTAGQVDLKALTLVIGDAT